MLEKTLDFLCCPELPSNTFLHPCPSPVLTSCPWTSYLPDPQYSCLLGSCPIAWTLLWKLPNPVLPCYSPHLEPSDSWGWLCNPFTAVMRIVFDQSAEGYSGARKLLNLVSGCDESSSVSDFSFKFEWTLLARITKLSMFLHWLFKNLKTNLLLTCYQTPSDSTQSNQISYPGWFLVARLADWEIVYVIRN